jgi:RNA polymerase sigma factor (TIGR02999 family)
LPAAYANHLAVAPIIAEAIAMPPFPDDFTELISRAGQGDRAASDAAFATIYAQLKSRAVSMLGRHASNTLSATGLVHETWLKLIPEGRFTVESGAHFFHLAARAMRQILLDQARERGAVKRGGDMIRTELSDQLADAAGNVHDLLAIDQVLQQLEVVDPDLSQLVEAHFFGGLSFAEIAQQRACSERTVRRNWELARAFMLRQLSLND